MLRQIAAYRDNELVMVDRNALCYPESEPVETHDGAVIRHTQGYFSTDWYSDGTMACWLLMVRDTEEFDEVFHANVYAYLFPEKEYLPVIRVYDAAGLVNLLNYLDCTLYGSVLDRDL